MATLLSETITTNINHFIERAWLLPPLIKWLEPPSRRLFILTGLPGTGKSMISAWLSGKGTTLAGDASISQLETLRSKVGAAHFCIAASGTTDPRNLAKNLAEQLTQNIKGFSDALLKTLPDQIQIVVKQTIGTATGSSVTGVYIESLNMGALGDEASFNRLIREPLKQLYNDGYSEPLLLIIDSLDEAATYTGDINIVQLLTKLDDLPEPVRFLVTTRPDPRILKNFQGIQPFDLVENKPSEANDIWQYAYKRLARLEEPQRSHLANRISQSAAGIFLYASLVLSDMEARLSENTNIEDIDLPKDLAGLYQKFLNRELGKDEDHWYDIFKPLLGAIAVAQGNGLTRKQLEGIVKKDDLERELRICAQYLIGMPDGPFRVFHKSFADFLTEDEDNADYHIAPTSMHRRIATYYQRQYRDRWEKIDDYGIRYLLLHLLEFDKQVGNKLNRLDLYGIRHLFYHLQAANRTSDIGRVVDLVCEA
jgi:tRNA uridine 5-carbamoylmethylation protein Kti12